MTKMASIWEKPDAIAQMTAERVRYELQRFHAEIYFAPEVLHNMSAEYVTRHTSRDVAVKIVGMVATWRQERLLRVPANWWQHFKQRFFPAWALKRWPVLETVYDAAVILPRVPIVNPAYHTVEFAVWQGRGND